MTANDVANYILQARGPMSAMKLQKLVYYSQAWSLVWDDRPMFGDRIEAWANGPVCVSLYNSHRGRFTVEPGSIPGDAGALDQDARETVDAVLEFYGSKSAQWLSDLTHLEDPWKKTREKAGVRDGDLCSAEITLDAMAEYYLSLGPDAAK